MKIIRLIGIITIASVGVSFGASGFFGDAIIVANGLNYTAVGAGSPQLSGGFGTLLQGGTFTIQGFQINTYENGGDTLNRALLIWTIDDFSTQHQIALIPSTSSNPNGFGGVDRFWSINSSTQNLLDNSGLGTLSQGSYTFKAYWQVEGTNGGSPFSVYQSNGGSNYTAAFTVVPEPSAALLGGLGLLGLLRRRRA